MNTRLLSSRFARFLAAYLSLVMLALLYVPSAALPPSAAAGKQVIANFANIDETRKQQHAPPSSRGATTPVNPPAAENVAGTGSFVPMMFQTSQDPEFATARNRPQNRTGEAGVSLGSRNYNWSLPLVNLAGRAGMDLDLTLHYNSLVWTKQGMTTAFNLNRGFPRWATGTGHTAPGFELHLPFLQQRYTNQDYGGFAFMMISPSGGRVEFRQVGTSNVYEANDGSYSQLVDNGTAGATVRTTDGTLYTFGWVEIFQPQFGPAQVRTRRCTQIKDRNGNIISATYASNGAITTITDTLGRVINFNYITTFPVTLTSITTTRNGSTYTLASFTYGTQPYQVSFVTPDSGNNYNGTSASVLTQVNLPDGSYYTFNYNGYIQVYRITHYAADGHVLAYTNYNLPMDTSVPQPDCPRFTERRQWVENGVMNTSQEILTTYSSASDGSWTQTTAADGTTTHKEFFHTSGWQKGLPYLSEVWSGGVRRKWTTTLWTQDDVSLAYQKNPRVYDSTTEDAEGNRSRVDITYGVGWSLPTEVREYSQDGSGYAGFLRRTYYTYNLSQPYLDRRIIGLLESVNVIDENNNYAHRLTYEYDRGGEYLANTPAAATQHDGTNFSSGFVVGRGNRTDIWQWDANDPLNPAKAIRQKHIGYNINGSVVFTRDALNHQKTFSYTDSFSDGINRNTLAFPTTVTDEENFSSYVQHNYDNSLVTRTQDPKGAIEVTTYDAADRILQTTNQFNGAYLRFVYPTSHNLVQRYTTLQNGAGEAYTADYLDGWGRIRATVAEHPGSVGGFTATMIWYDAMGRAVQRTNPTEINASWATVGDDAATGWVWTYQTYDWSGRPLVTTNPDSSTREIVYGGCGCAGSEVTTLKDERGRRRRLTKDTLGRLKRVEELNWNQSVYATTNSTFNGRDQVTSVNQSGQVRTLNYDGYGRLQSRTTPEQGTATFTYFADGSMASATDARGASQTFTYDLRHLITGVTFGVPGGVAATSNISIGYDSVGNKTSMTDGLGSMTYAYNTNSELTSETRNFTGVGSYTMNYAYNLAGQLSSITNPWGAQVAYYYDKTGRPTSIGGSGYLGVSAYVNLITYRSFGMKSMAYNNGRTLSIQYDTRLRPTQWNIPGVMGWNYAYHYFGENTGRVMYAQNINDSTLDRSYDYDHLGRLTSSHSGGEARSHMGIGPGGVVNGPYSQRYYYDVFGNITAREGWGGDNPVFTATYTNNKRDGLTYDAAGNLTFDGGHTQTFDATGQAVAVSGGPYLLNNSYDGNQLRGKKVEGGVTTYYLRSTALGGRVVAEINGAGGWQRGYVYLGSELVALQQSGVYWMHQDSVAKSTRVTDHTGTVVSTIELDPWGGNTNRNNNDVFQPRRFTTYERDGNASDDAMFRRYNRWWSRFDQPDPYEGSYDAANPQSFNRYAYVQNDPVNFIDPSGLCVINIVITGVSTVSAETLTAAQNEITRIFSQAGQTVFFTSSGGGINYYINLANIADSQMPNALGSTRATFGSTTGVDNYGAAYPNRIDARNAPSAADRTMGMHPVNRGTALGRVIAHESGHYLLQIRNAQHSRSGLMRPQFTRDASLFRRGGNNDSAFHFSDAQREQINALCRTPLATDSAVPNNSITPRPLRRGDSGIPNRGIVPGGGVRVGGMGPLSWLEWLYGSRQPAKTETIDPRRFRF